MTKRIDRSAKEVVSKNYQAHKCSDSVLSQCRHGVSQRKDRPDCSDHDYSEDRELRQITWPFPVRVSISEETTSACARGCHTIHVYSTPFITLFRVDEVNSGVTIFMSII